MANLRILTKEDKHWQDVRERAAVAALQGILANTVLVDNLDNPRWNARAIQHANELVEKLKEK